MSGLLQHLKTVDSMLGSCAGIKPGIGEKYAVLWHERAEALAREVIELDPKRFEPFEVEWKHWDNGTDHIVIKKMTNEKKSDGILSNQHILFIASFHNNADTLSQLHLLHYICLQLRPSSVTIVLPLIPTGTMERIVPGKEGDVPTAVTLASMFNGLPFNPGVRIMTYEIHALQITFYFQGKSGITTHSAIPMLIDKTGPMDIRCVVFPDDGAKKRFSGFFDPTFEIVACAKQHSADDRITKKTLQIESGDPCGLNAVIVDDMTRSGSTMFECMKAVIKKEAKTVSMFVTHADFTDEFWMTLYVQFFGKNSDDIKRKFRKFYATNSLPDANIGIIKEKCNNCRDIYQRKLREMHQDGKNPFNKITNEFDGFEDMKIRGIDYTSLVSDWIPRLPVVPSGFFDKKIEILSLANSIVNDI